MWAKVCIHKRCPWTWVPALQSIEMLGMTTLQGPQMRTGADQIPGRSTGSSTQLARSRSRNRRWSLNRKASMIKLQGMYHLVNQPWARMVATILELCKIFGGLPDRASSQLKIKIIKNWTRHLQRKWRAKTKLMNILESNVEDTAELEVKRVRVATASLFLNLNINRLNRKDSNSHNRASNFSMKCLEDREKATQDHDQELRLTDKVTL